MYAKYMYAMPLYVVNTDDLYARALLTQMPERENPNQMS
jgi:hypothetical protein